MEIFTNNDNNGGWKSTTSLKSFSALNVIIISIQGDEQNRRFKY